MGLHDLLATTLESVVSKMALKIHQQNVKFTWTIDMLASFLLIFWQAMKYE